MTFFFFLKKDIFQLSNKILGTFSHKLMVLTQEWSRDLWDHTASMGIILLLQGH